MSSDCAIQLRTVGKTFATYAKPHHRLTASLPWSRTEPGRFTALKDINLDVPRGETLGIVGRNGCGKSTLLQIVCGILQPTTGTVRTFGRIAALLELGAGFNPEFTGRENVYLNAAVMGLSRAETDAKFEQIITFSGVGHFLDQPLKTYSSGMYIRLAFAVAINVDPDLLVIDEALAVGDEAFQRQCYARIRAIRDSGATVLFVSHGSATILELCDRALLLDAGEMLALGSPKSVMACYHKLLYAQADQVSAVRASLAADFLRGSVAESEVEVGARSGTTNDAPADSLDPTFVATPLFYPQQGARIHAPTLMTADQREVNVLIPGGWYTYTYRASFDRDAVRVRFGMMIKSITGLELAGAASATHGKGIDAVAPGFEVVVRFRFRCLLAPGTYFINAGVLGCTEEVEIFLARIVDATMFRVMHETDRLATGMVDLDVVPSVSVCERPGAGVDAELAGVLP